MNRRLTYAQALSEAHVQIMADDPQAMVLGLGVTDYKGIFGTTIEIARRFGPGRVIETPASENAITGVAIGAALAGSRPIVIHARNDFMFLTLDETINCAAKWKYTYGGGRGVPVVIRGIVGKGWGQGPTHAQSIQALFMHFPGIRVAMPSCAYDAKGILITASRQNAPFVIIEHRALYDQFGMVPHEPYTIEIGKGRIVERGSDITLVAVSLMVQEGLKARRALKRMGISMEVLDPRFLQPLDTDIIRASVRKTKRLLIADTSWLPCGFSSEVAAFAAEKLIGVLKTPVARIGLPACPSPVSQKLEEQFYPTYKTIFRQVCRMLGRKPDERLIRDTQVDTFKGPY